MRVFSMAVSSFLVAGFIQTAVGLSCYSGCAACWLDNVNGVDTKFACTGNFSVCSECPAGYHGLHCANSERCVCLPGQDCSEFGPCHCGVTVTWNEQKYCNAC